MSNPNAHIEDYIKYYCSFKHEPGYAILIKGRWGSGKTWFIQKALQELNDAGAKHLYVSLYGVTSFDEIEDVFFRQLHPLLSSKTMAITGKIIKSALKATIKLDLDSDGRADSLVTTQVPDINIPEYLINTAGFVIVFDDLERASIDLESLLGYINYYVEHQGYKVIVIANEEEILEREKNTTDFELTYSRIKEKLIGKTFEVKQNFEDALKCFISKIENKSTRIFLEKNTKLITQLYFQSEYKNLRHLKQSLWDFERLLTFISDEAKAKDKLVEHLLKIHLIFSFEIKSGNIPPAYILTIHKEYYSSFTTSSSKNKEITTYQKISEKYNNINLNDILLEESTWFELFDTGYCDHKTIENALRSSEYFSTENTPNWIKLWHAMDLNDNDFDSVLKSVENDFNQMNFTEVSTVRHVCGIFLWLSKIEIINKKPEEILNQSILHIDKLKNNGLLRNGFKNNKRIRIGIFDNDSWNGLGFFERESSQFKLLTDHINKMFERDELDNYPCAAKKLMNLMESDPELFYTKVTRCNSSESQYYNVPIFTHIEPQEFVNTFMSSDPNARNTVCYAFADRYKYSESKELLSPEMKWLESIIKHLESEKEKRHGKISSHQIHSYLNRFFIPAKNMLQHRDEQS